MIMITIPISWKNFPDADILYNFLKRMIFRTKLLKPSIRKATASV